MNSEIPVTPILQQLKKLPIFTQRSRIDESRDPARSGKFNEDYQAAQRECEHGHIPGSPVT
jgi:hypothetical protein